MGKAVDTAALKKLRKLYGYDIAIVRQSGYFFGDEENELESLALHHLDKQIIECLKEFKGYMGDSDISDSGAVSVLMGMCGVLLADIAQRKGKRAAKAAASFSKKYLEVRYSEILGDKK